MPRDPQGAETRVETRVEWRNVYEDGVSTDYETREDADLAARLYAQMFGDRIAIERIETRTTITRHTIPPHAGEETKG